MMQHAQVVTECDEYRNENEKLLEDVQSAQNAARAVQQKCDALKADFKHLQQQKENLTQQHRVSIMTLKEQLKQQRVDLERKFMTRCCGGGGGVTGGVQSETSCDVVDRCCDEHSSIHDLRPTPPHKKRKNNHSSESATSLLGIVPRDASETMSSMNSIDLNASDVEWTAESQETDKHSMHANSKPNGQQDNHALLYRMMKNQEQQLLAIKHQLTNAQFSPSKAARVALQESVCQHQHYQQTNEFAEQLQHEKHHCDNDVDHEIHDNISEDDVRRYQQNLSQLFIANELMPASQSHTSVHLSLNDSIDFIAQICNDLREQRRANMLSKTQISKLKRENKRVKQELMQLQVEYDNQQRKKLNKRMKNKNKKKQKEKKRKMRKQTSPSKSKSNEVDMVEKEELQPHRRIRSEPVIFRFEDDDHDDDEDDDEEEEEQAEEEQAAPAECVDDMSILCQLCDDLMSMMRYLEIVNNRSQYEYCCNKLQSLCDAVQDMANQYHSEVLQQSVHLLQPLMRSFACSGAKFKGKNQAMHDAINETKNLISDLYVLTESPRDHEHSLHSLHYEFDDEEIDHEAESLSDIVMHSEHDNDDDDEDDEDANGHDDDDANGCCECDGCAECKQFDELYGDGEREDENSAHYPRVQRIEESNKWFRHKISHAVITFNGQTYKRKFSDFEWLYKMLLLGNEMGGSMPRPIHHWNDIHELNKFLEHCHTSSWIRTFEAYHSIFFAESHKRWKVLRKRFDKSVEAKLANV